MATNESQKAAGTEQYSLAQILGIWLAVALPFAILGWVVFPALAPDFEADPIGRGAVKMAAMAVGLIWDFVLAMIFVYREEGDLRWATIRRRLWLNTPRDPRTGEPRRKLWLWLIPIVLLHFATAPILLNVDRWAYTVLPFLAPPPGYELGAFLESPEVRAQLVGAWGILGLFIVMGVFNTVLGEEFLFRGLLLPKMESVFGKWDWLANGVLGTLYHLDMPWSLLGTTSVAWIFFNALPARYFRST
jgi:membrane protease YdiL (CAAX protease family)